MQGSSSADVAKRIIQIRGSLTQGSFATELDVNRNSVLRAEKGDGYPSVKFLNAVFENFGVLQTWTLTGKGPTYLTEGQTDVDILSKIIVAPHHGHDQDYYYIPKTEAKLSAGDGAFVTSEKHEGRYAFRKDWISNLTTGPANLVLMDVTGNSMTPTIQDNDTVMIDTARTQIHDGRIYALRMDHTISIKRLGLIPGEKVRIIADNRDEYPPYESPAQDINIIGQVIWYASTLVRR